MESSTAIVATTGKELPIPVPSAKSHRTPNPHSRAHAVTPGISLIAGAVAGATEAAITYPFEFAKTRSQLKYSTTTAANSTSKFPLSILVQTVRQEGLRSIYTGCSTLVIGTACKAGVRFLTFDAIKGKLTDADGKLSPVRGVIAGMAAGAVESVVAITPTERIKTALIDDSRVAVRRYNGGLHALRTIVAEHGVREVYRGLVSTTIKQSATSAVRMGSYNILKESLPSRFAGSRNPAVTFAMGATAGVVTVYATQPFDTIKTRTQGARGIAISEAVRDVVRDGGVKAFWSGSSMRLGRLILSGGIVFTIYESVSATLMGWRPAKGDMGVQVHGSGAQGRL